MKYQKTSWPLYLLHLLYIVTPCQYKNCNILKITTEHVRRFLHNHQLVEFMP